ncbi:MAG TPA: SPOR domain-containing protein, partial [Longimicrobiales bacterium]|nr:SPOR domain-containing protein [Longimicrobiales bacterium]
MVLLSTEGALAGGWVGPVAVDLVTAWSQVGTRVVLADAGLSDPVVHEALGIPNHEGLVDALRWGASVQRVVRRPEGRSFLALTAGTAVADTEAVLALPRWRALCAGFREAGVTLAVLLPASEDAVAAVLAQADGIVLLAGSDEDPGPLVTDVQAPVLAVMGRHGSAAAAGEAEAPPEASLAEPPSAEPPPAEPPPAEPPSAEAPSLGDVWGDEAALPTFELPQGPEGEESGDVSSWGSLADDGAPPFLEPLDPEAPVSGADDPPAGEAGAADDAFAVADRPPGEEGFDAGADASRPADPAFRARFLSEPEEPEPLDDDDFQLSSGADRAPDTGDEEFVLPDPIPVPPSLEEIVEESEAPRRGRLGMLLLLLLLLLVAAGAAAVWFGYVEVPGLSRMLRAESSVPAPALPTPTQTSAPAVLGSDAPGLQGYSLALGSFREGAVADETVQRLAAQVPGVLFQSVPVEVDGALFYRVLAGPAADSAAATALATHIAQATSLDPTPWVIRWTPFAFAVEELPDRDAARRRAADLAE